MRPTRSDVAGAAWLSLLFPALTVAANFDCSHIEADQYTFDLSKLGGPHSVMDSKPQPPSMLNITFTINICGPLERVGSPPAEEECPGGTRVCAIERLINPVEQQNTISRVIPIAGELLDYKDGGPLDPIPTRLRTSSSESDADKVGVRIALNGGIYAGRKQAAVVDFLCDPNLTGLEGKFDPEDKYKDAKKRGLEERDVDGETTKSSLRYVFYGADPENPSSDLLKLEWRTKEACESDASNGSKGSWGFFTWFILIAFLVISAYLIFGSWLNYNRYGARGWDLLPHGDTIRDIPYLFKDWSRRVLSTLQGSGSRGGYSAV